MLQDEFHINMRRRMKENYYLHGGKQRQQIRTLMNRLKLDESIFSETDSLEERVLKLKLLSNESKALKEQEKLREIREKCS